MTTTATIHPRTRKGRRSWVGTRIAAQPKGSVGVCPDGHDETTAAGMCGWVVLTGREGLSLHRGLESVVVAVGAAAGSVRDPTQAGARWRTVVCAAGECGGEGIHQSAPELGAAPLAIPSA